MPTAITRYEFDVQGYARFTDGRHHWSSHQAAAKFRVQETRRGELKIIPVRLYKQGSKGSQTPSVRPWFPREEWKKMKQKAAKRFRDRQAAIADRRQSVREQTMIVEEVDASEAQKDKHHLQPHCERCIELGMNCSNRTIETLEGTFYRVRDMGEWRQRLDRLERCRAVTLYHETSRAAANAIIASQTMLRGGDGMLGGGIYFAESPEVCHLKAIHRGVVLEVTLKLGNTLMVDQPDPDITFQSLLEDGYDSVQADFPRTGTEWVVYNFDQVVSITEHGRRRRR